MTSLENRTAELQHAADENKGVLNFPQVSGFVAYLGTTTPEGKSVSFDGNTPELHVTASQDGVDLDFEFKKVNPNQYTFQCTKKGTKDVEA